MNRTMVRWSALPAAAALTAGLAACGSDNTGAGSAGTGAGSASAAADCPTGTLKGEGSSAQKNAIEAAIKSFQTRCTGATVNYSATGSGAGIKQFVAGQVDFGGSDSALSAAEATQAQNQCGSPAWNLPLVIGPVGIAYNLPGVEKMVLTADAAAKIFRGGIKQWNDPALAALNPGVALPAQPITVYFRSDESGTTDNFTKYLKAAAPASWPADASKKWTGPVGEGKPQNAGVASAIKSQPGSISYLEWSYITQNGLGMARIDTGSGPVELTSASVGKMIATAKQVGTGNDLSLSLDFATKEPGAYPINLVTYNIVCSKYADSTKAAFVRAFLGDFASGNVQDALEDQGYAPLPDSVATKVTAAIAAIG